MRDPRQMFERYGRQLLVEGVQFAGQQRLHGWAAVLACDTSDVGQQAGQAAGRYLVGAGVGRVVAPSAFAAELQGLDPQLQLLGGPGEAKPPVAHFWFARRDYGASVDIAVTDDEAGWAQGRSGPARVVTLRYDVGRPATAEDAVALGAAAADLLLADVLGLEPLPALVLCDWRDPEAPRIEKTPRRADGQGAAGTQAEAGLLAELRGLPAELQPIIADCEANYPNEACGLVVRTAEGRLKTVVAKNLQDRYHALDPAEFPRTSRTAYKLNERLIAKAAEQGEQLVCIWHSHCDAGAYFSAEDVRCAAPAGQPLYPGVGYLVVSVMGQKVRALEMYHFDAASGGFVAEAQA